MIKVNKYLLIVFCITIISAFVNAKVSNHYELRLKYHNGNVSFNSLSVKPTVNGIENIPGGYIAEMISNKNEILNITYFDFSSEIISEPDDSESAVGGFITINNSEEILELPYYDNAKEINIYNKNIIKILTIDVGQFSKEVNIKTEKAEDKEITEFISQEKMKKEEPKPQKKYFVYLYSVIVIFLFLIVLLFIKRKRSEKL